MVELYCNGSLVGQYEYDAWGQILAVKNGSGATITSSTDPAMVNPFRYRGYYYDSETGLYYLNYRYYDPVVKRFINADNPAYIGVGRSFVGFSLFAYCGNNSVTGYDPTGHWDWGGILVGLSIIASVAITVATCGVASPLAAVFAGAAVTTGVVTTYAAATDSTMVVDVCWGPTGTFKSATKAIAVTFGSESGWGFGVGYDYYSVPLKVFEW